MLEPGLDRSDRAGMERPAAGLRDSALADELAQRDPGGLQRELAREPPGGDGDDEREKRGDQQRGGGAAADDALQLTERRMGDEGEQHRPRDRHQEGAEQQVKLVAHQGQEAEEENPCDSLAIHHAAVGGPAYQIGPARSLAEASVARARDICYRSGFAADAAALDIQTCDEGT